MVGVALLVLVVVLLFVTAGVVTVSLGQERLDSAVVHSQGQYEVQLDEEGGDALELRVRQFRERAPDTEFRVLVNGRRVHQWDGRSPVEMECLYPGDRVYVASVNGDTTRKVDDHFVESATDCPHYNDFPSKFRYAVVEGTSHVVNERYAFGLAIDPNGDSVATDGNGGHDLALGPISLANEWHHVRKYDRSLEGVDPPVFVVVMVDNVHWTDVPKPSAHPSVAAGTYYNWTDDPPAGLTTGANSYSIAGSDVVIHPSDPSTEPTNDVFLLFKPGCDRSTVVFLGESAGYANDVYLDGTKVIDDTNAASPGQRFTAPGVECRGDTSW